MLLHIESQLMGAVMQELSSKAIPCLYAFDALYTAKSKASEVQTVMNEIALKMGIPCKAKVS